MEGGEDNHEAKNPSRAGLEKGARSHGDFGTGWFETPEYIAIAMELIEHGDLAEYLDGKPCPESEARHIASQILSGLTVMHQYGITHRDLKPANIFISALSPDIRVKIGDFGISKRTHSSSPTSVGTNLHTLCYTEPYVAPELINRSATYTSAVDLWAVGCIVHEILLGKVPFANTFLLMEYCNGPGKTKLLNDLRSGMGITAGAVELVEQMLSPNPTDRPTVEDAAGISWIANGDAKDTKKPSVSPGAESESELRRMIIGLQAELRQVKDKYATEIEEKQQEIQELREICEEEQRSRDIDALKAETRYNEMREKYWDMQEKNDELAHQNSNLQSRLDDASCTNRKDYDDMNWYKEKYLGEVDESRKLEDEVRKVRDEITLLEETLSWAERCMKKEVGEKKTLSVFSRAKRIFAKKDDDKKLTEGYDPYGSIPSLSRPYAYDDDGGEYGRRDQAEPWHRSDSYRGFPPLGPRGSSWDENRSSSDSDFPSYSRRGWPRDPPVNRF